MSAIADFAPRPTGKPLEEVTLSGKLFPWDLIAHAPVFLSMPASPHLYLACFSAAEKLEGVLSRARVSWDSVKRIEDGQEFLESMPRQCGGQEIKIIIDPYFTPEGRVRFTEIKWD